MAKGYKTGGRQNFKSNCRFIKLKFLNHNYSKL